MLRPERLSSVMVMREVEGGEIPIPAGETVELARSVGALEAMAYTHTCYEGLQPPCGTCPACVLRAKGFAEAGIADPLLERLRQGEFNR